MDLNNLSNTQLNLLMVAVIWEMIWKGFALWKAARNSDQNWFVVLIAINSIGILPIIYLLINKKSESSES